MTKKTSPLRTAPPRPVPRTPGGGGATAKNKRPATAKGRR